MRSLRRCGVLAAITLLACADSWAQHQPAPFVLRTHRMDVDVDGAPRAYGPPGMPTLDSLDDAHEQRRKQAPIVGYMLDDQGRPIVQGPNDPAPGFYVSQTTFEDESRSERDPLRYVDATRINYVVLGDEAHRRGAAIGDFVAVYSVRKKTCSFGIVADSGNPSGDEGSLHLLQSLGYPFHDGFFDSVEEPDIFIRFYPRSNPKKLFFRQQSLLDAAAKKHGVSCDFSAFVASKK